MTNYFYYLKALYFYFTGKKHHLKKGEKMNPLFFTGIEMLRKRYLFLFRKKYVIKSLNNRKGECKQCGTCCRTMILCPHLKEDSCTIYQDGDLSKFCKLYPLDKADQNLSGTVGKCGYYWEKTK